MAYKAKLGPLSLAQVNYCMGYYHGCKQPPTQEAVCGRTSMPCCANEKCVLLALQLAVEREETLVVTLKKLVVTLKKYEEENSMAYKGTLIRNPVETPDSKCVTDGCLNPPRWMWEYKDTRVACCKNEKCRITAMKTVVDQADIQKLPNFAVSI